LSHGTCSYIRVYITAVVDSVMLCLQHDFYNIIFKIKLYIASGPPPQGTNHEAPLYTVLSILLLPPSSHMRLLLSVPFSKTHVMC
jgi:hypothetical protein